MGSASTLECPSELCGIWKQEKKRCESVCPLLAGLGISNSLQYIACPVADATHTTLRISCPEAGKLEIVDKTFLGRNSTLVPLDGSETPKKTKGRGKTFMLSGRVEERHDQTADGAVSIVNCRLIERGDGWSTRMERFLEPRSAGAHESAGAQKPTLVERHVLTRPDKEDVVVHRYFTQQEEGDNVKASEPKPLNQFDQATRPLVSEIKPTLSRKQ